VKRFFVLILVGLLTIFLLGCVQKYNKENNNSLKDEPGIIGYIMSKKDGRILVVNPDASGSDDGEYYEAIWFSNAPEDIGVGEKVKVWYSILQESYPAQSEVEHLEVIPSQKPEGANLTEAEALSKALLSLENKPDVLLTVRSIEYDQDFNIWNIQLKDVYGGELVTITVDDSDQTAFSSLGGIRLGDSFEDVIKILGKEYKKVDRIDYSGSIGEDMIVLEFSKGIEVILGKESNKVIMVVSHSPDFETDLGVNVGDRAKVVFEKYKPRFAEVKSRHGDETLTGWFHLGNEQVMVFDFNKADQVRTNENVIPDSTVQEIVLAYWKHFD
jgi:hypothetical protein